MLQRVSADATGNREVQELPDYSLRLMNRGHRHLPRDQPGCSHNADPPRMAPRSMSLAEFRGHHQHDELAKLAGLHFRHDLTTDEREVPKQATKTITWHASFGSVVGLESAASWRIESAHCVGIGSTSSGLLTSRSR